MRNEIERKFLIKELPDLSKVIPRTYERYFLDAVLGTEERIQRVDDKFFYEKKTEISSIERGRNEKREIDESEFNILKQNARGPIIRESFTISTKPEISIKIYHGRFVGLMRVEVDFASTDEAQFFKPLSWMGEEITNSPLSRDKQLLELDSAHFKRFLEKGF